MQGLGELWDREGNAGANTAAAETDETEAKRGGWEESGKEEESSRRDVEGGADLPTYGADVGRADGKDISSIVSDDTHWT